MKYRLIAILCVNFILSACVQAPVFKGDDFTHIRSNYPIVSVNGEQVEPVYQLDILAGDISLIIIYHTYRINYACTFNWKAEPGIAYEVTDHEHGKPLTLYRWEATNEFWAARLDKIEPIQCIPRDRE